MINQVVKKKDEFEKEKAKEIAKLGVNLQKAELEKEVAQKERKELQEEIGDKNEEVEQ